jgi:hypothetical protein
MPHPDDTEPPRPTAGHADARTRRPDDDPRTAAQWRRLLREQAPPDELADLPWRARRRGRRAWKSARRTQREQWVKTERRRVPTPITIPIIALLLAGAVGLASWLQHDQDRPAGARPSPSATPTAAQNADTAPPTPAATSPSTTRPATPDGIAKAFVTGYCTRKPLQDGSHKAAVERAAPYASQPLVANLNRHDDRDFNQLVAAQALTATPTTVTIGGPTAAQRPAPDTAVRVYRQATAVITVKGTDNYDYTRHLTLEIARSDVGQPWMVTRVLGLKE